MSEGALVLHEHLHCDSFWIGIVVGPYVDDTAQAQQAVARASEPGTHAVAPADESATGTAHVVPRAPAATPTSGVVAAALGLSRARGIRHVPTRASTMSDRSRVLPLVSSVG